MTEHLQAVLFQILTGLSLAMPLLEFLVSKTTTKVDDEIVATIQKVLGVIPRVRPGSGMTK